jgi:hypothetical protein
MVLAAVVLFLLGRLTASTNPAAVVIHRVTVYPPTTNAVVPATTTTTTATPPAPTTTLPPAPSPTTGAMVAVPDAVIPGGPAVGIAQLSAAGFRHAIAHEVVPDKANCNSIVAQVPPAGTIAPVGSTVTVTVARCSKARHAR